MGNYRPVHFIIVIFLMGGHTGYTCEDGYRGVKFICRQGEIADSAFTLFLLKLSERHPRFPTLPYAALCYKLNVSKTRIIIAFNLSSNGE